MAYEIAIVTGLIGTIMILAYLGTTLKEDKYVPIKLLFFFISLFLILLTFNTTSLIIDAQGENITTTLIVTDYAIIGGNLTVGGNITADYYFGDGSQLTGVAGGIWTNVSGVGTYYDDINITGNLIVNANFTVDSDVLHVDSIGNKVGIGTTTPNEKLTVVGNVNITGNLSYKTIYAQLSDLVDQSFGATGTPQPLNLTTTDEIYGLTVLESNITIQMSGVYSIIAQPQVSTGAGGAGTFHMWLEKHDTTQWLNVSNSNVELVLASNEQNVIPLITTLRLNANEKIRVMGSVSDTAIKLDAQTPDGEPTIPSVIYTMFKLGD